MESPWKTHGSPWKIHGKFIWPNSHGKLMDVSWDISVREVLAVRRFFSVFLPRDATQSAVIDMGSRLSVCASVRPSVCDVEVS